MLNRNALWILIVAPVATILVCVASAVVAGLTALSTFGGPGTPRVPPAQRVAANLVLFEVRPGLRSVRTVLRSPVDAAGFRGRFTDTSSADTMTEATRAHDWRSRVLVAFASSTGCGSPKTAFLTTVGSADYSMETISGPDPGECAAPYTVLAIFALPVARAPKSLKLNGLRPQPANPARTEVFSRLTGTHPPAGGTEVSQPDHRRSFLATLPAEMAASFETAALGRPPDTRMFAYVLSGCRLTGSFLAVSPDSLRPKPIGGTTVNCVAPEFYVAAFSVPHNLINPSTTIN